MNKIFTILIVGLVVFAGYFLFAPQNANGPAITNFEECVAEGNPVMESYPRQCRSREGDVFVENIGNILEKSDMIRIDAPRPNTTITSPLSVRGEARGAWFFEATFPVVLTDRDGRIIAEGYAEAKGDWTIENFVPFTGTLEFTVPEYGERGSLILQKANPPGLSEHDDALEIPIRYVTVNEQALEQKGSEGTHRAMLRTNYGDITLELFSERAPNTVKNFLTLARAGFYDGTRFHRVISGFMIQGGDPLSRDVAQKARWGTGGPGYRFADEIHSENKNLTGTIAMANAGPNTNGSQFFINVADNNFLDAKHTVFGRVVSGMDVVRKIESLETDAADRPLKDALITSVSVDN